jgi:hypothetical protein
VMRDDNGISGTLDGIESGIDENRYDRWPHTGSETDVEAGPVVGPDTVTLCDEPKWGVVSEERLSLNPFGI